MLAPIRITTSRADQWLFFRNFDVDENFLLICALQPIDARSDASRPKPVVNNHHGNIRRTTVQHAQQRRDPAEARSVADARRHRNHRHGHQPAHHARQRAFHPRHTNNYPRLGQHFAVRQQPVYSRHSNVVQMLRAVAHQPRSEQRFLSHRNVARPRGHHDNRSFAGNFRTALDGDHTRQRMKFRCPADLSHRGKGLGIRSRHQHVASRVFLAQHRPHNVRNLLRRLALAEHHLGKSLPQRPVVVHLREPQILERQMPQPLHRLFNVKSLRPDSLQQSSDFVLAHRACILAFCQGSSEAKVASGNPYHRVRRQNPPPILFPKEVIVPRTAQSTTTDRGIKQCPIMVFVETDLGKTDDAPRLGILRVESLPSFPNAFLEERGLFCFRDIRLGKRRWNRLRERFLLCVAFHVVVYRSQVHVLAKHARQLVSSLRRAIRGLTSEAGILFGRVQQNQLARLGPFAGMSSSPVDDSAINRVHVRIDRRCRWMFRLKVRRLKRENANRKTASHQKSLQHKQASHLLRHPATPESCQRVGQIFPRRASFAQTIDWLPLPSLNFGIWKFLSPPTNSPISPKWPRRKAAPSTPWHMKSSAAIWKKRLASSEPWSLAKPSSSAANTSPTIKSLNASSNSSSLDFQNGSALVF